MIVGTNVWKRGRASAVVVVLTAGLACAPKVTTPDVAECEKNTTAGVTFENKSNTNGTYDVIWDGSKVFTLAPGAKSTEMTVAATVQHTLTFKFSNTSTLACTSGSPILAICAHQNYWCTG